VLFLLLASFFASLLRKMGKATAKMAFLSNLLILFLLLGIPYGDSPENLESIVDNLLERA